MISAGHCWPCNDSRNVYIRNISLPRAAGNSGAGCFLAFLPGPFGAASFDDLFLPIFDQDRQFCKKKGKKTLLVLINLARVIENGPIFAKGSGNDDWIYLIYLSLRLYLRWLLMSMRIGDLLWKREFCFHRDLYILCSLKWTNS